jgi:hypothetical protein
VVAFPCRTSQTTHGFDLYDRRVYGALGCSFMAGPAFMSGSVKVLILVYAERVLLFLLLLLSVNTNEEHNRIV